MTETNPTPLVPLVTFWCLRRTTVLPRRAKARFPSSRTGEAGSCLDGRETEPPLEGGRSYPSWGTVRVQEPEHRVLSVREYFEVPKRSWLARTFTSGFPPGEYAWFVEYGFVNIGEQPYWLVKQVELTRASSTDRAARVVQTYDNCRRFGADSVIRYGDAVDASQPDSRLAPGGMGDEPPTPTPVLETGLEVGADLDAAKSPQISRQQGPPPPRCTTTAFIRRANLSEAKRPLRRYSN